MACLGIALNLSWVCLGTALGLFWAYLGSVFCLLGLARETPSLCRKSSLILTKNVSASEKEAHDPFSRVHRWSIPTSLLSWDYSDVISGFVFGSFSRLVFAFVLNWFLAPACAVTIMTNVSGC